MWEGLHHYRWYHFWDGGPGVYNKLVKQALEQTSKQHSFVASASASAIKSLPWIPSMMEYGCDV